MPSPPYPEIFTLLNGDVVPRCQEIEIASTFQIPTFQIIGLPGPEVSEAKDRIRSAIESSGFTFPKRKVILNLSPASVRKEGTGLDLAMALAVLVESWKVDGRRAKFPYPRIFAWGELGLDGRIKSVRSPARAIAAAIRGGANLILVAESDESRFLQAAGDLYREEATPLIIGLPHFRDIETVVCDGANRLAREPARGSESPPAARHLLPIPRHTAELLQIAAAGAHHFLLLGPKGIGKSLALEWFLALQPELDRETSRTRRFLAEITGREDEEPHRRIGTQVKPAALLGSFAGGSLRPGEFSLAHGGVLLADEFPEWSRDSREALREPLERRKVTLTRVDGVLELPCDFTFAGNGNLCPCGGVPDAPVDGKFSPCRCHPVAREKYLAKLGGPILDRLDLVAVLHSSPSTSQGKAAFAEVREQTRTARAELVARYTLPPGKLSAADLEDLLDQNPELRKGLDAISFRSFRDRHKTLRIALTLAALRKRDPDAEIFREARSLRIESDKAGHLRAGA